MFDWMAIIKPTLNNILDNDHFLASIEKEGKRSLTPANLKPSSKSGLPTHITYERLSRTSDIPFNRIREWKRRDTASHRKRVLFHSKDFRNNQDVPSPKSKAYLGIAPNSTVSYHQLLASLPSGHGYERTRVESCRIRDDQANRSYQERELQLAILRMYEDKNVLRRTCRKCFVHTSKNQNTFNRFQGVVYCNRCYDKVIDEAPIRKLLIFVPPPSLC